MEIYLNYDCDIESSARENVWERFVTAISKVMILPNAEIQMMNPSLAQNQVNKPTGFLPNMTSGNLVTYTKEQVKELYAASGDTGRLKKRAFYLLIRGVLKSLVGWCDLRISENESRGKVEEGVISKQGEEEKKVQRNGNYSIQNQKQRKGLLVDGITKFNTDKPKNVIIFN